MVLKSDFPQITYSLLTGATRDTNIQTIVVIWSIMETIKEIEIWMKALSDGTRLRIIRVLNQGTFRVGEMMQILGIGQSLVSHHLRALAKTNLVIQRKQGSLVYYSLSEREHALNSQAIIEQVNKLLKESVISNSDVREANRILKQRTLQARDFFNRVGDGWDGLQNRFVDSETYLDAILEVVPVCDCLVDAGCGTGALMRELNLRANLMIGVDHSPEMLEVARNNLDLWHVHRWELRLGELAHLPLSDGEADVLITAMVLHHLNDPDRVLPELYRALSDDGLLVIADMLSHDDERLRNEAADLWLGFNPVELTTWLKNTGFHNINMRVVKSRKNRLPTLLATACKRPDAA